MKFALFRSKKTEVEGNFTAKVLEQSADFAQSKEKGALFTLEELPGLLRTCLNDLENTEYYKQNGLVYFYLDTVGSRIRKGLKKFDPEGQTIKEMFKSVSKRKYSKLPFNERAYFYKGDQALSVSLFRAPTIFYSGRVFIDGSDIDTVDSPVVVIKIESEVKDAVRR